MIHTQEFWRRVPLDSISSIASGNSIPAKDRKGKFAASKVNGRPFISTKDVSLDGVVNLETEVAIPPSHSSDFRVASAHSTLVCSEGGSAGRKIGWLGRDAHYGNKLFAVTAKGNINSKFLYYFHLTDDFSVQFKNRMTGLIGGVSLNKFKSISLPLPPLEEQKRIVAVLDKAFAALDRARALAEANLADAEEVFENYLAAVFLGKGASWSVRKIGDLLTLQRGYDITKKDQKAGEVPVVSSGGAKSFHNVVKAHAPGVVVGRKGSIGSVYLIEEDFWPHDTTLYVKDFKGNDPLLVFYLLKGLKLAKLDTGAANPSLNRNLIHPMTVFWPLDEEQRKVAEGLRSIENHSKVLAAQYECKLLVLADLRQSLLQKAFAGELT